jgi:hypothetical protein
LDGEIPQWDLCGYGTLSLEKEKKKTAKEHPEWWFPYYCTSQAISGDNPFIVTTNC